MVPFLKAFGIPEKEIQQQCIICPSDHSELFAGGEASRSKGVFYSVLNTPSASVICTRYNMLIGDCVLKLNDTGCRSLYLFGSCGSTGELPVGGKVILRKSYVLESFTEMLEFKGRPDVCFPDDDLVAAFLASAADRSVVPAYGATVSSLLLERERLPWFIKNHVGCVDMESSIVFAAANHIKRKAIALLYVTDIIGRKSVFGPLEQEDRDRINRAKTDLAQRLIDFIRQGNGA